MEPIEAIFRVVTPMFMSTSIHTLHGKVKTLLHDSPVTGEVMIYDHNP